MSTTSGRPVFLNPAQIRLPLPGLVSILHRVSGVALVLSIPWLAHLLALSLSGPEGFDRVGGMLGSGAVPLLLWLFFWGLVHHLFAGIRHLFLDLDLGLDKPVARATAWVVLAGAPVVALLGLVVLP